MADRISDTEAMDVFKYIKEKYVEWFILSILNKHFRNPNAIDNMKNVATLTKIPFTGNMINALSKGLNLALVPRSILN